ncbi:hypothetical protein C1H46_025520 [Malus baccata]|uniref:Uncharacterized protein n=1 Tax=Malus baccata TaxID=106549 RepID=A0A540LR81_MALBA|nr:hypothetical protein C1H46_025520 [Malus baccata]
MVCRIFMWSFVWGTISRGNLGAFLAQDGVGTIVEGVNPSVEGYAPFQLLSMD